jgi:hypothetical protein
VSLLAGVKTEVRIGLLIRLWAASMRVLGRSVSLEICPAAYAPLISRKSCAAHARPPPSHAFP